MGRKHIHSWHYGEPKIYIIGDRFRERICRVIRFCLCGVYEEPEFHELLTKQPNE